MHYIITTTTTKTTINTQTFFVWLQTHTHTSREPNSHRRRVWNGETLVAVIRFRFCAEASPNRGYVYRLRSVLFQGRRVAKECERNEDVDDWCIYTFIYNEWDCIEFASIHHDAIEDCLLNNPQLSYQLCVALGSLGNAAMFGRMDFIVAAMCWKSRLQRIAAANA